MGGDLARHAQANKGVVHHVVDGLAAGTLVDGLAPITVPLLVGISHGRGGMMRIHEQAHYRTYDAVAIMSFTNSREDKKLPKTSGALP